MKSHKILICLIVIIPLLFFLLLLYFCHFSDPPYVKYYCTYYYFDINNLKFREVKYLMFLPIKDKVFETDLSKMWKDINGEYNESDWQIISCFSGFSRKSPNYAFAAAPQIELIMKAYFNRAIFSDSAKQYVITSLLKNMHDTNGPPYQMYLRQLGNLVDDYACTGNTIDVDQIRGMLSNKVGQLDSESVAP